MVWQILFLEDLRGSWTQDTEKVCVYLQTVFHGSVPSAGHVVYRACGVERAKRDSAWDVWSLPRRVAAVLWSWREQYMWPERNGLEVLYTFTIQVGLGGTARWLREISLRHSGQREISVMQNAYYTPGEQREFPSNLNNSLLSYNAKIHF